MTNAPSRGAGACCYWPADKVETPPRSYKDFMDPAYEGHIALPSITNGYGTDILVMLDIFGDVVETIRRTNPQGWIGSTRRPFMPIYTGDQVVELV